MGTGGKGGDTAMHEAAFMGEVTASITHEVQNVLAIIQQSAGLMGDFLDLSRKESLKSLGFRKGFQYHDKFATLIAAIGEQVERGSHLIGGLNRLAHVPDSQADTTDVGRSVLLLFSLIGRIARKRRVEFVLEAVEGEHKAACAPMQALMALYGVARALVEALSGCAVRVSVADCEDGPMVAFILPEGGEGCPAISVPGEFAFSGAGAGPCAHIEGGRIRLVFPRQTGAQAD